MRGPTGDGRRRGARRDGEGRGRRPGAGKLVAGLVVAMLLATPWAAVSGAVPGPRAAIGQEEENVDEQARALLARAEALYRSDRPVDALPFLDRLVERLEPRLGELGQQGRLILRRAALYRAIIHWRQGERGAADESLDVLVSMAPAYRLGSSAPPELQERFQARRERLVGFLRIGLFPSDARVEVDGERLDPVPDLVPLLAGEHTVRAFAAGYAPQREEVVIRPNRTENVGFELARTSATLRIATRPPGATVAVDGDVMGRTRPPEGATAGQEEIASRPLVVEGLLPGSHELEVSLADRRPFRQRIEVTELTDYDLGVLDLEPSVGILVLRGLPRDVEVRVDGEAREPRWSTTAETARLEVAVGEHDLLVADGNARVYERTVAISDGATSALDVELRPGVVLAGVVGGDDLDRQGLEESLTRRLGGLEGWALLDRRRAGRAALEEAGVASGGLVDADLGGRSEARRALEGLAPGGLFLVAGIPDGGVGPARAWVWTPPPGPASAVRFALPLGDDGALDALVEFLRAPLPGVGPWFGAVVADSRLAETPLVVAVTPGSPAATAGLQAGDRITAVGGEEVTRATDVTARLRDLPPFAGVAVRRVRGTSPGVESLTLGSSPRVTGPTSGRAAPFVWAAAGAELRRADAEMPRWALELQRGQALRGAGEWSRAAELLDAIQAPGDEPFGAAAVSYWLGVALLESPEPDLERARTALERAAVDATARLGSHDGPLVAPRARARLAELEALGGPG